MADVLAYSTDRARVLQIEDEARKLSFRVKVTEDFEIAKRWLETRDFDVLIVDDVCGREHCKTLWTLLWKRQEQASCFLIASSCDPVEKARLLFQGVTVFDTEQALENLIIYLEELAAYKEYIKEHQSFEILLVEDLDSPREIIAIYLETLGYPDVVPVRSADEALECLHQEPGRFSCVLTDLKMPGMQGEELLETIRKDPLLARLPVIVLTAHGTMERVKECLRIGASGFLVKPPRKHEIKKELLRARRIILGLQSPRLVSHSDLATLDALLHEVT